MVDRDSEETRFCAKEANTGAFDLCIGIERKLAGCLAGVMSVARNIRNKKMEVIANSTRVRCQFDMLTGAHLVEPPSQGPRWPGVHKAEISLRSPSQSDN